MYAELEARRILGDFRPGAGSASGRTSSPPTTSSASRSQQIGEIVETGAFERHLGAATFALRLPCRPGIVRSQIPLARDRTQAVALGAALVAAHRCTGRASYDHARCPCKPSEKFLQEIVSTVASSLELDRGAAQPSCGSMSDASGVHACFVYVVSDDGEQLDDARGVASVRAPGGKGRHSSAARASPGGRPTRGEPAFIRENALADPRDEVRPRSSRRSSYQSLLARFRSSVAAARRSARSRAHTERPREFSDDEVDFVVTSASLVAGAIENARLYEETRLRVAELEQLTELAEAIARAERLDELLETVVADARPLLAATAPAMSTCSIRRSEELDLKASDPEPGTARRDARPRGARPRSSHRGGRSTRLAVPLVANGELIGLLVAEGSARVEPRSRRRQPGRRRRSRRCRSSSSSPRRTSSRTSSRSSPAGAPRGDLERSRGASRLRPRPASRRASSRNRANELARARALRMRRSGSLFDHRDELAPRACQARRRPSSDWFLERLRRAHERARCSPISVGVSSVCQGEAAFADGFAEAQQALARHRCPQRQRPKRARLRRARRVQVPASRRGRRRHPRRDRRRGLRSSPSTTRSAARSSVATLEEFLRRHGSISATSEALYVHPNTLRQRLRSDRASSRGSGSPPRRLARRSRSP